MRQARYGCILALVWLVYHLNGFETREQVAFSAQLQLGTSSPAQVGQKIILLGPVKNEGEKMHNKRSK